MGGSIMLSVDTEEFDLPKEHGVDISLEDGVKVSEYGVNQILHLLKKYKVRATFFCTANFVVNAENTVQRIISDGHEIASHGVDHWSPKPEDVKKSKDIIEALTHQKVHGYRQPRMFEVSDDDLADAGYTYNSSLNPAFIPGRYMHLNMPRTCFLKEGLIHVPASVTPVVRFPLFWLSLHTLPQWLYHFMVKWTLMHDGYFNTYFHPWEFYELKEHGEWNIPWLIKNNSGEKMYRRFDSFVKMLIGTGASFVTYSEFVKNNTHNL